MMLRLNPETKPESSVHAVCRCEDKPDADLFRRLARLVVRLIAFVTVARARSVSCAFAKVDVCDDGTARASVASVELGKITVKSRPFQQVVQIYRLVRNNVKQHRYDTMPRERPGPIPLSAFLSA